MGGKLERPRIIRRGPSTVEPTKETNWIGISVESEQGQPENYLFWEGYTDSFFDPEIQESVAQFIASIRLQMDVKIIVGYNIHPASDPDQEKIRPITNLKKGFALYVEEKKRPGFSFNVRTENLKTVEQLQKEDPEAYQQAFKEAFDSLPNVRERNPRKTKYEKLMSGLISSSAIDAEPQKTGLKTWESIMSQIPAEQILDRFEVTEPEKRKVTLKHPPIAYLLGSATKEPQALYNHKTGATDLVHIVTEGSDMFGPKSPEEAMLWKGIFNHSVGTARQIYYLTKRLLELTPDQREEFKNAGFNFSEFDSFDPNSLPQILRDIFLCSHLSRRRVDERSLYQDQVDNGAHPEGTTSQTALRLLIEENQAPTELWSLIKKVEAHSEHMIGQVKDRGYFDNILDAMLTYADWTFGQKTVSLDERFPQIEGERKDLQPTMLDTFRTAGKNFEQVFNRILKTDILEELKGLQPEDWETEIRIAYCAPSGIDPKIAFPNYPFTT